MKDSKMTTIQLKWKLAPVIESAFCSLSLLWYKFSWYYANHI